MWHTYIQHLKYINLYWKHYNINDEIISFISDALYRKINSFHEDFKSFEVQIKREVLRNKTKIQEILSILKDNFSNEGNEEMAQDLLPDFPLMSVEEYTQFNETLKNDEQIRKCFVSISLIE